MEQLEQALAYLGRDPLFYMDMLEPLRRGTAELLYAEEDGVLLCESGGIHMMSAAGPAAAERCFALLSRCAMLVGHELWYKAEAVRRFGLHEEQICYQAAWLAPEPPAAAPFGGELRLLGEEMAQWVYDHYSHPFGGVAYMQGALRRGMLGAFVDGACAGFAGFHEEGSIGMLEVLPAYRRRGVGEALLRGAVRLALERGQYAFGQVFTDNQASLALQRKVGVSVSRERLFWLF
ncbi:GNAT family N-acetyltransferase [Lawsonibacter sp.]|uniref:GNAT family N-acetyltransferase n=1 Tax=Lawsonibacter sp. TaxID=2185275 RepID=UPI00258F485B|nr:GNAT family N-acetyltransferase [Lawsonibacter sp.]MCI6398721.1 GNAT family N-acetyltransferase [Lawsonibacter sp.]MDY2976966.1 GNAT family N-acetyltransferase [Oscillospiraceae bacterium]